MSRVLVLGATGFIGFSVAAAFERKGYNVYGGARSAEKAKNLAKNDIKPVLGQAQEVSKWLPVAEESDIIIESLADYQDPTTGKIVADALLALLKRKPHILVIYTSGTWVHGDSRGSAELVDEHVPLNPFGIVAWRPALEKAYTDAGAVVLRPGLLYGKSGSITGIWFEQVVAGKITFPPHAVSAFVHVEDLADAYVLTATHAARARGQAFNLVSQVEHLATAFEVTKHATNPALQVVTSDAAAAPGSLAEPLAGTALVDGGKARAVLGWAPTHRSFTVGLPRWFEAWKAHK